MLTIYSLFCLYFVLILLLIMLPALQCRERAGGQDREHVAGPVYQLGERGARSRQHQEDLHGGSVPFVLPEARPRGSLRGVE